MTAPKRGGAPMVQSSGSMVMANANGVAPDADFRAREQRRAEVYDSLVRRLHGIQGFPKDCGDRACRRARACVGAGLRCKRDHPLPPSTPQEEAEAMQMFRDALRSHARRRGLPCL